MALRPKYKALSSKELGRWIEEGKEFYLLDTLGSDHFQKVRLPDAINACIFEVIFTDQVKAKIADKNAEIALYGSSARSRDAITAAEKLDQEGYRNIYVLTGGIEAWRSAGLPLEGNAIDDPDDPQALLKMEQADRIYRVDPDRSILQWTGRNPNSSHFGTVKIAGGELVSNNGHITGAFDIDLNSIDNTDLEGDELKPVLIAHLKSEDFFLTRLFPKATFEIVSARPVKEPYLSAPNVHIHGNLKLRGVKTQLDFLATVARTPENGVIAEAHFDIDRTRWGVIYGSTRFFEHLGKHLVFDLISFQIKISAS